MTFARVRISVTYIIEFAQVLILCTTHARLCRCGVSGAPVVADTDAAVGSSGGGGSGAMIANLSMSDLRWGDDIGHVQALVT